MTQRLNVFTYAADFEASVAFWTRALAIQSTVATRNWVAFDVGQARIAVHRAREGEEHDPGFHVSLSVDDIEGDFRRFREAGAAVLTPVVDERYGRTAVVADPDGNPIQLVVEEPLNFESAEATPAAGPLATARLDEVILYVDDLPRMLEFYRDVLGLREQARHERLAALRGDGGAEIVLHAGRDGTTTGNKVWFPQFIVADIDTAVSGLRERGVEVGDVEERPYGRYVRFRDPEGNVVGLEQPPASP